jgi:hypothetical protein
MVLSVILCFATVMTGELEAKTHNKIEIDKFMKRNQYLSVQEAIEQFEEKIQKKVSLPTVLPFNPTHKFGKLTKNGDLQIHYVNNENEQQDFIFYIMYPASEIDKHISYEDKVVTLKNGSKAFFRTNSIHLRTLAFKKHELGYLIGGNPKQNNKYNVEGLIEIANSI